MDDKEFPGTESRLRRYTLVDGPKLKREFLSGNFRPAFFRVQRNDDNTLVAARYREVNVAGGVTNYLITISKREKTVRDHSHTKQDHGYPDVDITTLLSCH
jgi:hypothetical protein